MLEKLAAGAIALSVLLLTACSGPGPEPAQYDLLIVNGLVYKIDFSGESSNEMQFDDLFVGGESS